MSKRRYLLIAFLLIAVLALAACGGNKESAAPSSTDGGGADVAAGQKIFQETVIGTNPGCSTCHSLEPDKILVGPSLAGIAGRAGSIVSGMSAEEYIHQAIVEPDAHVAEGFTVGSMPAGFDKALSEQQLNDLVAYLMTLK